MATSEEFTGNYHRNDADLAAWLAQTEEPALEPGLPIVDPHHHLWDDHRGRYLAEELLGDIAGGHDVRATIFIEAMSGYRADGPERLRPIGETLLVRRVAEAAPAARTRIAAATIGFADLTLGAAVDEVLDAHQEADAKRFRGIRHATPNDPAIGRHAYRQHPPGALRERSFREGFARLAQRGLSFDAWCYYPQLPDVADLAAAFPDATIVIDHVGGMLGVGAHGRAREESFARWRRHIRALAERPNVVVKLGGLGMLSLGLGYHRRAVPPGSEELARDWRPYVETCLAAFGPDRSMFESNFPVDRQSCGYTILWNAFKRLAAGLSAAEKTALFSGTAARVYRIDL